MDLQNSALSAIVGLMIVQGGNVIVKNVLKGRRSCIFRNFPVKPGYCCFCLGNTRQSASKRMEPFVTDRSKWYDHIEDHLNELRDFSCSHPACCVEFENIKDLRDHLVLPQHAQTSFSYLNCFYRGVLRVLLIGWVCAGTTLKR